LLFTNKDSVVFHCKKLLVLQLSFGNHNLTYHFGASPCSPYLENPTNLPLWHLLKLSIRTYWVWSMIPSNQRWISSSNDS
jgi:hypothetical protein